MLPGRRFEVFGAVAALMGAALLVGFLIQPNAWDVSSGEAQLLLVGRIAGLGGTYLALVGLVLASRVPWLEQAAGHDQMLFWHARLGRTAVVGITVHVVGITLGYGGFSSFFGQLWVFVTEYPWMLSAILGFVFLVGAAATSVARVRSRLRYESWWQVHLYFYLAIALAFAHQIVDGVMFAHASAYRAAWTAVYVSAFAVLLTYRVVLPAMRSWRTALRVAGVDEHPDGSVSICMTGRDVRSLGARPGQFFNWRFPPSWWEAHPYSLSRAPGDGVLRITVKPLGDHSRSMKGLRVGSRVFFEGPYGAFTWDRLTSLRVVMVAGGIGITPIRALLDDIPAGVDVHVIYRSVHQSDFVFADELMHLKVPVTFVSGPPSLHPMDPAQLLALDPSITHGDVFVCGPPGMNSVVVKSLAMLGLPADRIHVEDFSWAVAA